MHLAMTGLFRAKWSAEVHEEWMRNLLLNRPDLTRVQLERTRDLMDKHALDALVTDYEDLIPDLRLPDPSDRHVVAAAVRSGAEVIVTMNLKDFPAAVLDSFGIVAQHPDDFIVHLLSLSLGAVLSAARAHRESLKSPQKSESEYLDILDRQGLTQTVSVLREYIGAI
jgi:hypothetical protein